MKVFWKNFLTLFTKSFQIFEEHKQINLIQSIGKCDKGYATVDVAPVGAKQVQTFFPHQIMSQPLIRKAFAPIDVKLIKGMLIAEGDIFIESKEYRGDNELYFLRSLLDEKKWILSRDEIKNQKSIFNRINKRFLSNELNKELFVV